jgi:cholesterol oxidase
LEQFDFVIIGSGFGGSVAAMRLTQKGYSVAVLEKGRRYHSRDFAKTNWNLKKFLWAPWFGLYGIQQITLLKGIMLFHGAGVGGGSLVYANTLMEPSAKVFNSALWPAGSDWAAELAPHFHTARRMLGVTQNKIISEAEALMQKLALEMNCEKTFHLTDVGVYFGEPGVTASDPYFGGAGPERAGCIGCGACMVGCRENAKNTLDKNYLFFAEKWGAKIFPEQKVKKIEVLAGGYAVHAQKKILAKKVIVASGVLGSVELLFRSLQNPPAGLGERVRTNGESLCGVTSLDTHRDLSKGIAIGSAIHPDEHTKIEPVRYNSGSSLMRTMAEPMTGPGGKLVRPLKLIWRVLSDLPNFVRLWSVKNWAEQTVILLVMQTLDYDMKLKFGRSVFTLWRKGLVGSGNFPSYLEVAQTATKKLAKMINGIPQNASSEVLLGIPATAHILGGCGLGSVIDTNHEVIGHPGLYVCDGSVIPANLGVNPSLTITALAERFADRIAVKDPLIFKNRQIYFSPD